MDTINIHCGEGIPRRCFKMTFNGVSKNVCFCYNQWPMTDFGAYPKQPGPDPAPYVHIEGVTPEIMRDIKILDMIQYFSGHFRGEVGNAIRDATARGLKSIQEKLPTGISLE